MELYKSPDIILSKIAYMRYALEAAAEIQKVSMKYVRSRVVYHDKHIVGYGNVVKTKGYVLAKIDPETTDNSIIQQLLENYEGWLEYQLEELIG